MLHPIFGTDENADDSDTSNDADVAVNNGVDNDNDQTEDQSKLEPNLDLKTVYWIISTEKSKLDDQLTYYDNPLDMFFGPVSSMFDTLEKHKIESYADAFNFLARLKSVMLEIHQLIQFMEKQRSLKGVELPKVVGQQCYDTVQGMLKLDAEQHTFMKEFKKGLEENNMSMEIYDMALEFIKDSVYRALYHLGEWIDEFFLEEDEVPRDDRIEDNDDNNSDEDEKPILSDYSVCCDRNRGKDYYTHCLRTHTTTNMSPEEIHELGLKEVERISEEILTNVKAHVITISADEQISSFVEAVEYIRKISTDPTNIYPDTPEGEVEIKNDICTIDARIKQSLSELFLPGSLPKSECEYKFTPEHQKESMPAGYYLEPSFDGKNKGTFYMNLRSELLRFGLPTLVAHEAIPGHHFQLSSVAESNMHPIRKISFYNDLNAYLEGWALYTEKLGLVIGLYDTPLIMVGHLMDEMLRASRLVIDTGIHHYGWDRQKAFDYMNSVCPYPLKSNEIEIDRYIGWPGQACSYKVGQLEILRLRKERIDNNQSPAEFNTRLIRGGAVPISLLNQL
jgi:uncharacterized protein (DUF885 family)